MIPVLPTHVIILKSGSLPHMIMPMELSDTENPRRYGSDLKRKLKKEGAFELYEKIVQLKMLSSDGKRYKTDVANTEQLLRIIQSVPSPKAEPFKAWLARVGRERIEETLTGC